MEATGIPVTEWCYAYRKGSRKFLRFYTEDARDLWVSVFPKGRMAVHPGSEEHRLILCQETKTAAELDMVHPGLILRIEDGFPEVPEKADEASRQAIGALLADTKRGQPWNL